MNKFFMDVKFLEGNIPIKIFGINLPKLLSKPNKIIQPISIGVVSESGNQFYAISKEFNLKETWNNYQLEDTSCLGVKSNRIHYVRENILKPIFQAWIKKDSHWTNKDLTLGNWEFNYKNFKYFLEKYGKSNDEIAYELNNFVSFNSFLETYVRDNLAKFYCYNSAYKWPAFCSFYGGKNKIPYYYSKYCHDLKQDLEVLGNSKKLHHETLNSFLDIVKKSKSFPKKQSNFIALDKANWNRDLYEFIKKY